MSYERNSTIADRCIKCGGVLPCDLHSREFKNALLAPGERDSHRLRMEKIWEDASRRYKQIERIDDSSFLCSGLDEIHQSPVSILTRNRTNPNSWTFDDLQRSVHINGVVGHDDLRASTLARVSNQRLLDLELNDGWIWLRELRGNRWEETDAPAELNAYDTTDFGFKRFFPLGNDAFLLVADEISASSSGMGYIFRLVTVSQDGKMSVEKITDTEGESLDETTFLTDAVQLPDQSLLVARTDFGEDDGDGWYRLVPPADGSAHGWSFEVLRDADENPIMFYKTTTKIGVLSDVQSIAATSRRELFILEKQQGENTWISKMINEERIPRHFQADLEPVSISAFSERCFVAAWSDGALELWRRSDERGWNCIELDLGYAPEFAYGSLPITPISNDPFAFILCDARGTSYWRINEKEINAAHERKAEQHRLEPMPCDITYGYTNGYANTA